MTENSPIDRKTNILLIIPQLGSGGSERVVLDLAERVDRERFDAHVLAFRGGGLEAAFRRACKEVFILEKKPGLDLTAMVEIARIIKRHRIGVVNAHHYLALFYAYFGSKVLGAARLIYTEHSVPEVEMVTKTKHQHVFRLMLRYIDAVIGVSEEVTQAFVDFTPRRKGKIIPIPNGVDIGKFAAMKELRNVARQKWSFDPDDFVIGVVANFRKVKNHVCLMRAAARLRKDFPGLRLLFAGTAHPGPENSEPEIRRTLNEHDLDEMVVFAGYQTDLANVLPALDVFCLPSLSEGLPVSILEAMAAGVPVIGSRGRGIREVVRHGDTGMLFEIDSETDLAAKLSEMISDPQLRSTLARNGFDHVYRNHHLDAWSERYSRLFLAP